MTQTQIEEFRKWVEEKPGREVEIRIIFSHKKRIKAYVDVYDASLQIGQTVKCVDEINLEAAARERFEELKRKLGEEDLKKPKMKFSWFLIMAAIQMKWL